MLSRIGPVLLAVLLTPLPALADGNPQPGGQGQQQGNNSFNDPFSPFNPSSMAAKNREQQERALEKQRETWRDRFNQRRESGWKEPAGTRFFSRLFQRPASLTEVDASRKKWAADIFTRFRRTDRVAFSTVTTGTGQAPLMDKVNRTALFDNTGSFGKEVQRATSHTRIGYWEAAGGGGKGKLVKPERKVKQPTRWSRPERRPDRAGWSATPDRVDRARGWKVHKASPPPPRRVVKPPMWRIQKH